MSTIASLLAERFQLVPPRLHVNSSPQTLIAETLARGEGRLNDNGALCVSTGKFTGRSPKDKFIVVDDITRDAVDWGDVNNPFDPQDFENLCRDVIRHLSGRELWTRDAFACADPDYRIGLRIVTETPWADLFCHNLFLRAGAGEFPSSGDDWTVLHAPGFAADPAVHRTRQGNFTILDFTRRILLIGGTAYTGEIKKGIFSVLNFVLPQDRGVLPMHCSANEGKRGDVALFFGLSGTGKTTLSADPERPLIGDDEHGWAEGCVFNFEGGCYAKCIHLSEKSESQIFHAIRRGTLLENVVFRAGTNTVDYDDDSITENTRAAYPIDFIPAKPGSTGGNPRNIFFLTCDAFGVLPPIARLTRAQAMYHYVSGYTARVAGTEIGVKEPQPVFSACFGKVFLPLNPVEYAELLGRMLEAHPEVKVWLVNTGWSGGGCGAGQRLSLDHTRAMIAAAMSGALDQVAYAPHRNFGVAMPAHCPGVPDGLLDPRNTWADKDAYDGAANRLAQLFIDNFTRYRHKAGPATRAAAPVVHTFAQTDRH